MPSKSTLRNVEIKAKISDFEGTISKVRALCSGDTGKILEQDDMFFNVPNGRLKLRRENNSVCELIYYNRPDTEGPKLSEYSMCSVAYSQGEDLANVLTMAHGVKGRVQKTRHLYMYNQTRIHIDEVKNLGNFLELEVVLNTDQTLNDGQKIAEEIMSSLGIAENDLLAQAYMDILLKK